MSPWQLGDRGTQTGPSIGAGPGRLPIAPMAAVSALFLRNRRADGRKQISGRSAFLPCGIFGRQADPRLPPLRPYVCGNPQAIAVIEGSCSNNDKTGARAVRIVNARKTIRTCILQRYTAFVMQLELAQVSRNAEVLLPRDGMLAESTAGPGLAIQAVTGICQGKRMRRQSPSNRSTAASSLEYLHGQTSRRSCSFSHRRCRVMSSVDDLSSAVRVTTVMTNEGRVPGGDTPIVCPNLTARNYEGVS